jgi:hypothetical protein
MKQKMREGLMQHLFSKINAFPIFLQNNALEANIA